MYICYTGLLQKSAEPYAIFGLPRIYASRHSTLVLQENRVELRSVSVSVSVYDYDCVCVSK
jgi:hypothetical protein